MADHDGITERTQAEVLERSQPYEEAPESTKKAFRRREQEPASLAKRPFDEPQNSVPPKPSNLVFYLLGVFFLFVLFNAAKPGSRD